MPELNNNIYSILLAGGTGKRLWPVSRQFYPKQLVNFMGDLSLVQATIKRLTPIFSTENIRIVCGKDHFYEMARNMEHIGINSNNKIIAEPCGRNTGPAILLAVLILAKKDPDSVLCVFPADHVIQDIQGFHNKIQSAVKLAQKNYIVTFGIQPNYPETGYGYIEGAEPVSHKAFNIKRFVEKPDMQTAKEYVKAGNFFWNSGMFAFKASIMVEEFQKHEPKLYNKMSSILEKKDLPSLEEYQCLLNISIDYAIMEKTKRGVVLPSDFGWSDIGSWKSLYDFIPKDKDNNVLKGDIITNKTENCLIMGQNRLIATNHLKDTVVIDTPDAVFISDLDNSRDVKSIVKELKNQDRKESLQHKTIHVEWGSITVLEESENYKIENLKIYPDSTLNIDAKACATHLIVTKGDAYITTAAGQRILKTGESTILVKGDHAQLKNTGDQNLLIIKVKTG